MQAVAWQYLSCRLLLQNPTDDSYKIILFTGNSIHWIADTNSTKWTKSIIYKHNAATKRQNIRLPIGGGGVAALKSRWVNSHTLMNYPVSIFAEIPYSQGQQFVCSTQSGSQNHKCLSPVAKMKKFWITEGIYWHAHCAEHSPRSRQILPFPLRQTINVSRHKIDR